MATYAAPRPIRERDVLCSFSCGEPALDEWLHKRAAANEGRASRTYVVTADRAVEVVAYYALAAGGVRVAEAPAKLRCNMPPLVPVMVLGRLAVDLRHQGSGLGSDLLGDAMRRTLQVSRIAGIRALIVHAIGERVVDFYRRYGFLDFPSGSRTLFLPVETILAALGEER